MKLIQVLILYYRSLKPTHGYEIQRFIQVHELDKWIKIQSGSIYYAISKLEKKKLIVLTDEQIIGEGGYSRKIYAITEAGQQELESKIKDYINLPIYDVGSDKFFMYSLLAKVDRASFESVIKNHIRVLTEHKSYLEKWRKVKVSENSLALNKISFQMMISSLGYQIQWHEALLSQYDEIVNERAHLEKLICLFDFNRAIEIELDSVNNIDELEHKMYGK